MENKELILRYVDGDNVGNPITIITNDTPIAKWILGKIAESGLQSIVIIDSPSVSKEMQLKSNL